MKLGYVIHYVPDVAKALTFYEQAFGLTRAFLSPEGTFGALSTGETTLAFADEEMLVRDLQLDFQPNRPSAKPYGAEIALTTENVAEALVRATSAGAELIKPAEAKPWGQVVGYVRDLNGALVEICTPMAV